MRHVIIDTDPGVDDALALMLAFNSPELQVEAVTTVAGNVDQDRAHRNALKILEFLGVDGVPIARGAPRPLLREGSNDAEIHGKTGLGDAELPEPRLKSDGRSAVEVILEKAGDLGDGLTIIAIGPLTNIASALLVEPRLMDGVSGLVVMGGAFNLTPYGHGNVTPVAEFNIWYDPEAAKVVFDSGMPVTAVGLDVTTNPDNRLSRGLFEEIEGLGTRRARLVADLCRGFIRRFGGVSLHDPLAVAAALDPGLVRTEPYAVDVETVSELTRGQTIVDRRDPRHVRRRREPNVDVCVSLDGERFLKLFMDRVVHG
ncbi:MAG: nucleoside hydrolase [Candidatus Bathyarchaeia archaeon]